MTIQTGALALVAALGIGAGVYTQTGQPTVDNGGQPVQSEQVEPQTQPTQPTHPTQHGQQLVDCASLNTQHQQLVNELSSMDKNMDTLLTTMREAKNDRAKLDATVAVVDAMVTQGRQLRERMLAVHHQSMAYMMGHRDGNAAVEPCPITLEPESNLTTPDQTTPPPQQSPEYGPPAPNQPNQ